MKMRVENTVGNTWIFSVIFVAIDGDLSGARIGETKITKNERTTFDVVNTGKKLRHFIIMTGFTQKFKQTFTLYTY